MLTKEYKILKYIYRKKEITATKLSKKFPDIDLYFERIKKYLQIQPSNLVYNEKYRKKKRISEEEKIIALDFSGEEIIEKKRHEFWNFFLPYSITTLIAVASIISQFFD